MSYCAFHLKKRVFFFILNRPKKIYSDWPWKKKIGVHFLTHTWFLPSFYTHLHLFKQCQDDQQDINLSILLLNPPPTTTLSLMRAAPMNRQTIVTKASCFIEDGDPLSNGRGWDREQDGHVLEWYTLDAVERYCPPPKVFWDDHKEKRMEEMGKHMQKDFFNKRGERSPREQMQ